MLGPSPPFLLCLEGFLRPLQVLAVFCRTDHSFPRARIASAWCRAPLFPGVLISNSQVPVCVGPSLPWQEGWVGDQQTNTQSLSSRVSENGTQTTRVGPKQMTPLWGRWEDRVSPVTGGQTRLTDWVLQIRGVQAAGGEHARWGRGAQQGAGEGFT